LSCNGPFKGPRRARATAPTRACAKTAEQASSPVKAPKITEPPRTCTTTPDNGKPAGTTPRPPADHRPDAHPGTATAGTRAGQGAQTRPAHAAVDARLPASEPPLRRAATTVAIFIATGKQGRILAMAKVRPGQRQMPSRNKCASLPTRCGYRSRTVVYPSGAEFPILATCNERCISRVLEQLAFRGG
jgi:hypothetical protein